MNSAIVLLSGGLDSVVSLALIKQNCDKILALTFNYGQKAFEKEKTASEEIAKYYNVEHKIINLDWISEIYNCSVPQLNMEDLSNTEKTKNSAKAVWVPNRNALFINIAACYAEALKYDEIVIGANREEARTFKDNSVDFIDSINLSLKNSTENNVQVYAPLINYTKQDIVREGIRLNIPFNHIYSCYNSDEFHCGKCESCLRLKRALEQNNRPDIIEEVFGRENICRH